MSASGLEVSSRDEWLSWRRAGIGASDVAALMGLSPWASPYSVWADKVGLSPDTETSEAMEAGLRLEGAVSGWFADREGLHVVGEQTWCAHSELPWARATVDGFVVEGPNSSPSDALGTVEVKTTSATVSSWERDGVPLHYQCQAQWQMFVAGVERTWFAVLHASRGLRLGVYVLERDEADIAVMVERARVFWERNVLGAVAPDVDGHMATSAVLASLPQSSEGSDEAVDLDAVGLGDALARRAVLRRELKAATLALAEIDNELKVAMGGSPVGVWSGGRVSWATHERRSIDTKALRATLPEVAARFERTTSVRPFNVKESDPPGKGE